MPIRQFPSLERLLGFDDRRISLIVAVALAIGIAMRIANNIVRSKIGASGEAAHVAIAIAQGRGFADAFHVGQGATAHLLPIAPGIGGLVYSLLGVRSPSAEILLATWSIALVFCSYIIFSHVFRRLGVGDRARAGALMALSLVPVFLKMEAVDFRLWEGGLAVFLTSVFLLQATRTHPARSVGAAVRIALTAAMLFFVNPALGLGGVAGLLLLSLAHWTPRHGLMVMALTALFASLLITPWAIRNQQVLGDPVLLRSNAGLELAIGTDPAMLGRGRRDDVYREHVYRIHPYQSATAFEHMSRMGEVRYARMLGEQTKQWIRQHPGTEARLLLFHLRETFAPEPWLFRVWSKPIWAAGNSTVVSVVGIAGLAGMLSALIRRRRGWALIAAMVLVPAFALSPFQPITRYIYTYYAMLMFSAADFLPWLFRQFENWCRSLLMPKT